MNVENYERFLKSIDDDLSKIFEHQKEYIFCKKGCSYCCERGDYPLSELEYEYLKFGYDKLSFDMKEKIKKNIEIIKKGDKDSYKCPFLIENKCSIYQYRPFVCRTFGVLTEDKDGKPVYPFCATLGLNFSQIYDENRKCLSSDLVYKKNFKTFPKIFRLTNKVIRNLPIAEKLNINLGNSQRLIDFLEEDENL